ncbi:MAG: hypothetical protein MJ150_04805 [Clostridia bacterium]|nr:hypothetical protein [Clostridia bacterium]
MKKLEIEFFDEFRKVESVLNDRFDCKNGVSEYINRMSENQSTGEKKVPTWKDDFKTLKHLRWVRNQIAHNSEAEDICKKEDLKDIKEFRKSIETEKDPLSQIARKKKKKIEQNKKPLYLLLGIGIILVIVRWIVLFMEMKK